MPHLVTSSQGLDHIESYNARHYNAGTQGNGSFAFRGRGDFALSMPNTNTLRIASGDAQCCGAHWSIDGDYEEYTIETGTPGYKRIDLVVADIVTAPKEEIKIMVLKGEEVAGNDGEPVAPIPIQGNLNAGDTHVQMPICSVTLNGINPGDPVMLMDFLMPASEFQAAEKERWDSISLIDGVEVEASCYPNDKGMIALKHRGAVAILGLITSGPMVGKVYTSYRNSPTDTWHERYI